MWLTLALLIEDNGILIKYFPYIVKKKTIIYINLVERLQRQQSIEKQTKT